MHVFLPSQVPERVKLIIPDQLLDVNLTRELDDLTRLATQICQTPIAFTFLTAADHDWFPVQVGCSIEDMTGVTAFCQFAMRQADLLIVPDARSDQRFATNPLVVDEPYIRFYAGAPLIRPDGEVIGVLCVIDPVARELTLPQQQALSILSRQIVSQLEADQHRKQVQQAARQRTVHAETLHTFALAASSTTDLTELLKIALAHLLEALDLAYGEIWTPSHHLTGRRSAAGIEMTQKGEGMALDVGAPLAITDWQQLQTTQPALQHQAQMMSQQGIRASLVVPLVLAFQPLGGISVAAYQPREWTPEEIALALAISQQVNIASQRLQGEINLPARENPHQHIDATSFYYARTVRVQLDHTVLLEWATGGFTGITGYTSQAVAERGGIISMIPPLAIDEFLSNQQTLYQGQSAVYEYPIIARSGELRWLREHAYPVWEKGAEQTLRIYITGEDITEQKQAEEELRQTHALYRRAIAAADAVPYQRDYKTDSFVFVGEAIQQITGYAASKITPQMVDSLSLETIMRGETEGLSEAEAIRRTRLGEFYRWRCDSLIRTRTGEERWISDASVEIYDEHGKPSGSIGILMDISDRKQAEMALQESNYRLAEALEELRQTQQHLIQQERLRAVGTMASGIAHDFNNMLGPILGFTELLLLRPEGWHNPEKEMRYLKAIHMAAQSAATVISRLREFYRFRDGVEPQLPVDLHQVVEQAILLTQPHWKDQALASGLPVRIEADLQPVPIIQGSKSELQEMLTNLILNAVDALPTGGKITIRVFVDADKPDGHSDNHASITDYSPSYVVLEIGDTGMGMDQETQQHCFEPFFSTKGTHGTGLGLAVVYGIVQRHQGRIEIESTIGHGTTFRIYLPIPLQMPEFTHQPAPPSERPLHVLVVDDDPIVRDVVVEYLQYEEHSTETAANGAEGLEKFRAGQFDLVITDRAMPKLNGDRLAAAIKAVAASTPIILLTGFGEFMNAEGELPRGVDYIVSKPLTLDSLQQTIALAREKFS